MMRKNIWAFSLFWLPVAVFSAAPSKFRSLSNTMLALPAARGVEVEWVLPPVREKISLSEWRSYSFQVDEQGRPWFGAKGRFLLNPMKGYFLETGGLWNDLLLTESGERLATTLTDLAFLGKPQKLVRGENGVPRMPMVPFANLPRKGARLQEGGKDAIYFFTEKEVYVLHKKTAKNGYTLLFSAPGGIRDVAGDGETTYVAVGKVVLRLEKGKPAAGIFKNQELIEGLAYDSKIGVVYTTASSAGVILGKGGAMEFLRSPNPVARMRKGSVYLFLEDARGVLRIQGLEKGLRL